jgi:outer membrane protein insertion porin family
MPVRLLVLAAITGCAHAPPPACTLPLAMGGDAVLGDLAARTGTIAAIDVEGAPAVAPLLRGVIETHTGQALDEAPIQDDLRRLWATGVLADARVDARTTVAGVEVIFAVTPQPRIAAVDGATTPELRRLRYLAGVRYEPRRVQRIAGEIEAAYVRDGYLDARIAVKRRRSRDLELCVVAHPGARQTIATLTFAGAHAVPERVLLAALHGKGVNHPGGTYDPESLADDRAFLFNEYYERGMLDAKVGDPQVTRRGNTLAVAVPITEGPVYHLGKLTGLVVPRGLHTGDLFVRSKLAAATDALGTRLDAYVTPVTKLDTDRRRIDIDFQLEWRQPWSALRLLRSP